RTQATEAIAALRPLRYPFWLAVALETLAVALRNQGELAGAAGALREGLLLMRELDSLPWTAVALRRFGLLAAALGRPNEAVQLLAAGDALAGRTAVRLPPALPGEVETALSAARTRLGEAAFWAAAAAGAALSVEEAAALALAMPTVQQPSPVPA